MLCTHHKLSRLDLAIFGELVNRFYEINKLALGTLDGDDDV